MILLLGGTTEGNIVARQLASLGHQVLLSTATSLPLREELPDGVQRRVGLLDQDKMLELIKRHSIRAVVDVTHPYAAHITEIAWSTSLAAGIPYFVYERPSAIGPEDPVTWADSHEQAAQLATAQGKPVLVTVGVKNLRVYVEAARKTGTPIFVRVLNTPYAISYCRKLRLASSELIPACGPISEQEAKHLLEKHQIGVLVTKDSGTYGGTDAKLKAAKQAGRKVVVITRPAKPCQVYSSIDSLIAAVQESLSKAAQ